MNENTSNTARTGSTGEKPKGDGEGVFRGLAIAVMVVLVGLVIGLMAVQHAGESDPRRDTGKHIYLSLRYYAQANAGLLPPDLETMVPKYFIEGGEDESRRILQDWTLLAPQEKLDASREGQRILREKSSPGKEELLVVFADGRSEYRSAETFQD
jgi:hypothetical protein